MLAMCHNTHVVLCNVHDVAPVRGSLGGRQGSERLNAFPISTSWLQGPGSLSYMSHTVQIHEAQRGVQERPLPHLSFP